MATASMNTKLFALAACLCAAAQAIGQDGSTRAAGPLDAFGVSARQDECIRLRTSCRVCPGANVTLGDLAILDGALAKSLAGVIVIPASEAAGVQPLEVPIARVRSSLAAHDSSLEGRVLVNGSRTRVWVAKAPDVLPTVNPAPLATASPQIATVRDAIVEKVAGVLGVPTMAASLEFDAKDAEILAMATQGRTVAVSPTGVGERIGVMVKVYERDRVVASQSLRVGVKVRRQCAILNTSLDRGDVLSEASFRIEEREVAPGTPVADPKALAGRSAKSRLAAGHVIEARDVESPLVVSRGDVVAVECLSGAIMLKTYARARGSGREGDIVSFEPMRKGRRFEARVTGPGRAVALAEGPGEVSGTGLASEGLAEDAGTAFPATDASGTERLIPSLP